MELIMNLELKKNYDIYYSERMNEISEELYSLGYDLGKLK